MTNVKTEVYITRTVESTTATVQYVRISTHEFFKETVEIPGVHPIAMVLDYARAHNTDADRVPISFDGYKVNSRILRWKLSDILPLAETITRGKKSDANTDANADANTDAKDN